MFDRKSPAAHSESAGPATPEVSAFSLRLPLLEDGSEEARTWSALLPNTVAFSATRFSLRQAHGLFERHSAARAAIAATCLFMRGSSQAMNSCVDFVPVSSAPTP